MEEFFLFAAVGFLAQLVDGALGMAYGVISATVLLSMGVPPATASASIHASKIATGAASGLSHLMHRNVDKELLWRLALAGAVGGVAGTFLVTAIPGAAIKPWVISWLLFMGLLILWRAWRGVPPPVRPFRRRGVLGLAGGFLDAVGGGGWGPTVTTTLVGSGVPPRYAVGTANTAEFFVAVTVTIAFVTALLTGHWVETPNLETHIWAVAGLMTGGVIAAPIAGWITRVLPMRGLTWVIGLLIVGLALFQLVQILRG